MAWVGTVTFTTLSYYNYGDLNRENNDLQYLIDQLTALGYYPLGLHTVKTNYARTDFPHITDVNNIKSNILSIIQCFNPVSAPAIVINTYRLQLFNYVEANKLEINLQALYDMLNAVVASFKYSGTFVAGQDINL